MYKPILLFTLSFVLVTSILAPYTILLSEVKMELVGLEDFSEEELKLGEKEIFEMEVTLDIDHKYDLLLLQLESELAQFYQDYSFTHHSVILLPPPEQIS